MVADQRIGAADELLAVVGDLGSLLVEVAELALERNGIGFNRSGGENDGIAFLHAKLEGAGDEKVLPAVEAAAVLVGVGYALIPVRHVLVNGGFVADLEVKVREIGIHSERYSAGNGGVADVRHGILARERVDVAEGKERLQLELYLGRSADEVETDKDLVRIGHQKETLREHDFTHLVGDLRDRVGLEIDHVLVPFTTRLSSSEDRSRNLSPPKRSRVTAKSPW